MDSVGNSVAFRLGRWSAWAPGLASETDWQRWLKGQAGMAADDVPDMAFMPPLQRRRLGNMARMSFRVIENCLDEGQPSLPLVFASRHGELKRSYSLLSSLAEAEPLSPRDFSLSVHNATAGLHSIFRHNTAPSSAVAAGIDTLPAALLEAAVQARAAKQESLLVWVEDRIPDFYRRWLPAGVPVVACALRVGPASEGDSHCRLTWQAHQATGELAEPATETDVLTSLMGFLLADAGCKRWSGGRREWSLERTDVAT